MKFRGVGNELITGWLQFKSSGQVRLLKRMTLGQNLEAVKRAIEVYGETDSRQRPSCAKTLTQACVQCVQKTESRSVSWSRGKNQRE